MPSNGIKPIIIGFGFKAKRGKDTAVHAIINARGGEYDIRSYAFADALRKEVHESCVEEWKNVHPNDYVFDADPIDVVSVVCSKLGLPVDRNAVREPGYCFTKQRELYQWWGTEYRRKQNPFYWVNALRKTIEKEDPQIALISDIRFRNEISYIHSFEGYTVKVDRENYKETLSSSQSSHLSETELDNVPLKIWDYEMVTQNGDLEGAKQLAVKTFDKIIDSLKCPEMDAMLEYQKLIGATT